MKNKGITILEKLEEEREPPKKRTVVPTTAPLCESTASRSDRELRRACDEEKSATIATMSTKAPREIKEGLIVIR